MDFEKFKKITGVFDTRRDLVFFLLNVLLNFERLVHW